MKKKTKWVEGKRLAKKEKNENKICPGRAAKKYNTGYNNGYTQSEKSQNRITEHKKIIDNKKSLWKWDIEKKKLNWKRGKDNVKPEKIFKRYVYLRKIANLCASKKLLK